jgi:hypothetical protein
MRPRHNQGMIAAVSFVLALAITSRSAAITNNFQRVPFSREPAPCKGQPPLSCPQILAIQSSLIPGALVNRCTPKQAAQFPKNRSELAKSSDRLPYGASSSGRASLKIYFVRSATGAWRAAPRRDAKPSLRDRRPKVIRQGRMIFFAGF